MPGFELSYNGTSSAFTTTREPAISGSGRPHNTGRGVQPTSQQTRMFSYRYSAAWNDYVFSVSGLTTTERDAIDTFVDTANGAAFWVRAGTSCGMLTSYTKVKLGPDGQKLPWVPQAGQKWGVVLSLRESV